MRRLMIDRWLGALVGGAAVALALGSGAAQAAGPGVGSGAMHEGHTAAGPTASEPRPDSTDRAAVEPSTDASAAQSAEAAKRRAAQARQRARQAQRARAQREEQARQAELARQQEQARAAERALAEQEARRQQELARERARAQAQARARTRFALELGVGAGLAAMGATGMAVLGGGLYLDRQRQHQLEGLRDAGIDPSLVDLAPLDAQGQRARAMITVGAITGTAGLLVGGTMIGLGLLHRKAAAQGSGARASLRVQPTFGGIRIAGRF